MSQVGCWDMWDVPAAVAYCWSAHAESIGGPALVARWGQLAQGFEPPPGRRTELGLESGASFSCVAPFTKVRGFRVAPVEKDGDCFYSCIELALGTVMPTPPNVASLRMIPASQARTRCQPAPLTARE